MSWISSSGTSNISSSWICRSSLCSIKDYNNYDVRIVDLQVLLQSTWSKQVLLQGELSSSTGSTTEKDLTLHILNCIISHSLCWTTPSSSSRRGNTTTVPVGQKIVVRYKKRNHFVQNATLPSCCHSGFTFSHPTTIIACSCAYGLATHTVTSTSCYIMPIKWQILLDKGKVIYCQNYFVFGLSCASILITWIIPFLHKSAAEPIATFIVIKGAHPHYYNSPCTGKFTACLSEWDLSWGFVEFRLENQRFLLYMVDKQPALSIL